MRGYKDRPKIIQIIPCNHDMYALYRDPKDKDIFKEEIILFALCEDGKVYPMVFEADSGVDFAEYPYNFKEYELKGGEVYCKLDDD